MAASHTIGPHRGARAGRGAGGARGGGRVRHPRPACAGAVGRARASSSIRTVVVRHEQAASFAAVGYARTSDRVGVCITSTGPGAFNTFAGMGEADASSLRVLHITTQVPSDAGERGWMHESVGQSIAFTAVTRHHVAPGDAARARRVGRRGADGDRQPPRPGDDRGDDRPAEAAGRRSRRAASRRLAPPAPDPAAVARVRSLLDGARAPLVFAGGGCRLAADRVVALAEALDAPVVTSFNGKGVMPPGHPLHAGSSEEEPSIRRLIERLATSASRWARASRRSTPATGRSASPRRMVQVDLDPLADRPQLPGGRGRGRRRRAVLRRAAGSRRRRPARATAPARRARRSRGRQAEVAAARLRGRARADARSSSRAARRRASSSRT